MSLAWTHTAPSVAAAFLASLVEFVEALTVVLAVGSMRGWRNALSGSGAAVVVLVAIVAALGPALTRLPLHVLQLAVGALLLLFGLRWLRKAILRAARVIPLHDEGAIFAKETENLRRLDGRRGWDMAAFTASFQITLLEGTEVVFIVLAIGAGGSGLLLPAGLGALAALLLVIALGFAIHRPLARIPENTLKLVVGTLLSGFGTFWVGEGIGLSWPGADRSILALVAGFLATASLAILLCRARLAGREEAVAGRVDT
jgi:uncharacterized membrane protein